LKARIKSPNRRYAGYQRDFLFIDQVVCNIICLSSVFFIFSNALPGSFTKLQLIKI
jgi:hypothetical protein